jgi:predicted nucleic acid-binding Zn ribbon protein
LGVLGRAIAMSFQSLQQLLGFLEGQESWRGRRQLQLLLACWPEVVGGLVAAQTRPIAIQRRVLQVATSSSVWAQNLAFERLRILEKLNARLHGNLTDIKFSTAQWRSEFSSNASIWSESAILWRDHPSRLTEEPVSPTLPPPALTAPAPPSTPSPQGAYRDWARVMRSRSLQLPTCPACQCPTPQGELDRWSVCSLCAAKRFGRG